MIEVPGIHRIPLSCNVHCPTPSHTVFDSLPQILTMDAQVLNTELPYCSPEVWFADGNIIVQTEVTRVYHGILAANSPVLNVMLSLSLPDEMAWLATARLFIFTILRRIWYIF